MARYLRNTIILAALEATYATAATTAGADALLVSDVSINPLVAQNVDRDLVRGFFGGSEQLVGTRYVEITFTVELAGSGTATTPTKWGRLLQGCGFAQTVAAASVDYTPVSTFGANSSLTIDFHLDGVRYRLVGSRGTFTIEGVVGSRPVMRFRFIGAYAAPTATANPTPTYSLQATPLVVTDANSGDITLGAVTYTGATGVIAGGTVFPSRGINSIDVGNNLVYQALLGGESVEITQRNVTGSFSLELTAAQEVTAMADVVSNTVGGFGWTHGLTAGNIVVVHSPRVQRIDPRTEDLNGAVLHQFGARFVPNTGNDEIRIVTR